MIAVRNHLTSNLVSFPFNVSIELICLRISIESKDFYILNVYIPPKSPAAIYFEVSLALDHVIVTAGFNSNILLVGDFNLPNVNWIPSEDESYFEASSTSSQQELLLLDNIICTDLQQVSCIKNLKNRILDLVFSSDAASVVVVESATALSNIDSYHPPLDIFLDLSCHLLNNTQSHDCSYSLDFRKANFQLLYDELSSSGISDISLTNIDVAVTEFYTIFNNCLAKSVPTKLSKTTQVSHPWFTKELTSLRNKRNKAWKTYIKSLSTLDHNVYISLFEQFNNLSKSLYSDYLREMEVSLKLDPKKFWNFVNSKKKSDGYPINFVYNDSSLTSSSDICNAFSKNFSNSFIDTRVDIDVEFFEYLRDCPQVTFNNVPMEHDKIIHFLSLLKDDYSPGPDGIPPIILKKCSSIIAFPLQLLFELSLKSGKFPSVWKKSFITPVFKKGSKSDIKNYRPIAKLSCIPKLFEQVVCNSMTFFCKNIICNQQHGFMQRRSTVTNLLTFLHKCSNALENGQELDCIYTDFSKAFDQLSHDIIIFKLKAFGFPAGFIDWIYSYLRNRSYQVKFRNTFSNPFTANSGVPQGSHLGPILFILAINDVTSCIRNSEILVFADDMKIFKSICSSGDRVNLQADIDSFCTWCSKNGLNLNPAKCQTMTFSKKRVSITFDYNISQHTLCRVFSFKDLGIVFNSSLDFTEHINSLVKRANSMLGFVKRWSKEFQDPYVTLSLYNCFVRPHLEYASQVWTPFYDVHRSRIEAVQHNFVRFALKGLPWTDPYNLPPYEHRIQLLHIQSLLQRRVNNDIVFIHQLLSGALDAPDLLTCVGLNYRGGAHHLRSLELLHYPHHRTNYGMNEPLTRMCRLFNLNSKMIDFNDNKINLKNVLKTSAPRF